ncbi:UDP-N-acetylmuramate dehydrogenase [Faecalibaculum rodentium]|uniref:UDP-N-acetylmuramate dehydrogenase n=1 Tax=Faecalibaculum rodentium TaxID=1702221 RepID=UPI0023EFBDE6|nr:UDP-N-acetylmuramate dehydrogenase [Faecalibaculum rodentium]
MNLTDLLKLYGDVQEHEPMSAHTTYKIGGTARWFIQPRSVTALMRIMQLLDAENIPWIVLGRGSNLLVPDGAWPGAVINLDYTFNDCYFEPDGILYAQAGCALPALAVEAMKHSMSGLEFASGIPGSLGGGLYMNAGAYRSDLSSILLEVLILRDRKVEWVSREDLDYSYRHSAFQEHRDWTILAAKFQLEKSDQNRIRQLMASRQQRRMDTQPLDKPCAGSTFRNPGDMPAWEIIDRLGLRGRQIGGARISDKHSNFIVNAGGATCRDVMALIDLVKTKARRVFDVDMIPEVEIPEWTA